jgi:hypothetical protein
MQRCLIKRPEAAGRITERVTALTLRVNSGSGFAFSHTTLHRRFQSLMILRTHAGGDKLPSGPLGQAASRRALSKAACEAK